MAVQITNEDLIRRIDLSTEDPRRRWKDVIDKDRDAMVALAKQAVADFRSEVSALGYWFLPLAVYWLARFKEVNYIDESDALSAAIDVDGVGSAMMATLQRSYTLAHAEGCTAAVIAHPHLGLVHARCLDWEVMIPQIIKATRLFDFQRDGKTLFFAVGIAGMVGVLSGMRPGQYSVTINWAETRRKIIRNRPDPTLMLRRVLESCETYDEAVQELSKGGVGSSVFYTVCGTAKDQACVIEVGYTSAEREPETYTRKIEGRDWLVQTNHFDEGGTLKHQNKKTKLTSSDWSKEALLDSSRERRSVMEAQVRQAFAEQHALADFVQCLRVAPVKNIFTVQQMVLHPKSGSVHLWAGVDAGAPYTAVTDQM